MATGDARAVLGQEVHETDSAPPDGHGSVGRVEILRIVLVGIAVALSGWVRWRPVASLDVVALIAFVAGGVPI